MWLSRKSVNNNTFGLLRSTQQKACRRGDTNLAIQTSLEILDSGYPHPSIQYLKTICVEDKFPQGQQMIGDILMAEKDIKKVEKEVASERIALWAKKVASLPSDRHVAWLCKVALHNATKGIESDIPEVTMATNIEKILLRVPRRKERPTPNDITEREGFDRIQMIIGRLRNNEMTLWYQFKEMWKKSPKLTCRLYLYTIVANRFHDSTPASEVTITSEDMTRKAFEIPDYAMDKHTSAGKKRKRGLHHFLNVGAYIENPSDGYEKRQKIQEMAKVIYMEEEEKFGTANAKSNNSRARARASFNTLSMLRGQPVLEMKLTQKPCGNKPCSWIVSISSGKYFVKGPVNPSRVKFQIDIDRKKEQYGITPMNIDLIRQGELFYLCAPVFNGSNVSPTMFYNNVEMWNILKVLIFRHAFNVSDTNLRNVMVCNGEALSVDEMSGRRVCDNSTLMTMLFSKGKVPRKMWRIQMEKFIRERRDEFIQECEKYGDATAKLIEAV